MKKTSRAVLFLAAVAWLLPHYGQAFYNPSTGRWLSRDPVEEKGGRNLYGFLSNDAVAHVDRLGLMRWGDVMHLFDTLESILSKKHCCCMSTKHEVSMSLSGKAAGSQVTMTIDVSKNACVEQVFYFWWDCFTAQREYGSPFGTEAEWQDYGWHSGPRVKTSSEIGSAGGPWDLGDAHHWNWQAVVLYVYCGRDGYKHIGSRISDPLMWTWVNGRWGGPEYGGGGKKL
jgi:uncharacterized protein RhaS with RHS repeats